MRLHVFKLSWIYISLTWSWKLLLAYLNILYFRTFCLCPTINVLLHNCSPLYFMFSLFIHWIRLSLDQSSPVHSHLFILSYILENFDPFKYFFLPYFHWSTPFLKLNFHSRENQGYSHCIALVTYGGRQDPRFNYHLCLTASSSEWSTDKTNRHFYTV